MNSKIEIKDLINYKKYEVDNLPKGVSISNNVLFS